MLQILNENHLVGEVNVDDSGSIHGSQKIATEKGAIVVNVKQRGYGIALIQGIKYSKGKYIITCDSDGQHDLDNLLPFLIKLYEGYDLVTGDRFSGEIHKDVMLILHRYFGNPLLSYIGRVLFNCNVQDFHCGLRSFTKKVFTELDLQANGMEFSSEIIINSSIKKMKIAQVPTNIFPLYIGSFIIIKGLL